MPPRRLDILDKIAIGICLMWLVGWTALGVLLAAGVYRGQFEALTGLRKGAAIFAIFTGVGCIALIGLWPHRCLLRRQSPDETKGYGFEVKRP